MMNVYQKLVMASLLAGGPGMLGAAMETWEQRPALRIRARSIFEEMERRPTPPRVALVETESKRARRRREGRAKGKRG